MQPISPSPGRIVWYHPASTEKIAGNDGSGQPLSAQVARVNEDGTVNLSVLDANALSTPRLNVLLVQPSWPQPDEDQSYCYWMPYQVGQASKHAEENTTAASLVVETKTYSDGSSATGTAPLPELSSDQQDAKDKETPAGQQNQKAADPAAPPPADQQSQQEAA